MSNTALSSIDKDGRFVRADSVFRDQITPDGGKFPAEANRYHLYVSYACPWANRCLTTMYLKGLEDVIGLSVVHPTWQRTRPDDPDDQHLGWVFRKPDDPPLTSPTGKGSFSCEGCIPDPYKHAPNIRALYDLATGPEGKASKFSVPVLWDTKEKTIVNNESSEIMRMFNACFNKFAKNPELDIYPEKLRGEVEEVNKWTYPSINNGVYRCGFSQSQEAYDDAVEELTDALDRVEAILATGQPYIVGDQLTEADIRLFQTLVRFDEVYIVYFKTNTRAIRDYPNMLRYCKRIYRTPGVAQSIHMDHIKTHYFTSHPQLNNFAVIPKGKDFLGLLSQPL